jgi:predicted SnoaL-like aldol condensation-catalyzing enzyme
MLEIFGIFFFKTSIRAIDTIEIRKAVMNIMIVADIVRVEDGILVEHWDVIQDEAAREQSKSGLPMLGEKFPNI